MLRVSRTAAALLLAVPFAAGCAGGEEPAARPAKATVTTAAPAPEPLTPQAAERQFRTFTIDDNVARAAGDERLALSWVTDGQSMLTAAEYRRAVFDGDPVREYEYGKPKLYVPKLTSYPHWFVVQVPRTVKGDKKSTREAYLAFVRRGPAEGWKLSLSTLLAPKARAPRVALDAEGYATALATTDSSVLIQPRALPGIQATLAAEGPDSVAAKVMKAGPFTTGYYSQTRKDRRKGKDHGLVLEAVFVATPFPFFPLRTENGSGLVLYALSRNSVIKGKEKDKAKPPIPPDVAHLLDGTVKGSEIHTTDIFQFAAYDPVKAGGDGKAQGKADVMAEAGALARAATPPPK
ncbi:hypothetical protein ACGFNU_24560 [Spirillospora sp. NPDC048911]|uniref:hypothetical protein n=1 Tax=Spirillospora sp. NPDC048911 TaxID=3364527 RepID=UPI00371F3EB8